MVSKTYVMLTDKIRATVKVASARAGISMQQWIVEAIKQKIERDSGNVGLKAIKAKKLRDLRSLQAVSAARKIHEKQEHTQSVQQGS